MGKVVCVCGAGWGGVRWNSVGRCGPNLRIIMIVPTKSTRFLTDNFQRIYMVMIAVTPCMITTSKTS